MGTILVVDDEKKMCSVLKILLEDDGYEVHTAQTGEQALKALELYPRIDLIISDLRMPGVDGIELLRRLQKQGRSTPLILITAYGSIEVAVEAMKKGATDFITKPFNKDVFRHIVRKTLDRSAGLEGSEGQKPDLYERKLVYKSDAMEKVMNMIRKVAHVQTPLLIIGESGVGKEIVARAIHMMGSHPAKDRRTRPFATISCPSIPETLIASELFGYQKGAFSGASKDYRGKLWMANGGTLLLDEIGDLPLDVQPRLLRFLEEKTIQPLGGNSMVAVEARIICATNRNVGDMVRRGAFREDLYYRINTITITIPPLRERRADILPLARHFMARYNEETGKTVRRISPDVAEAFRHYWWPGNVRELRNVIERAVVLSNGNTLVIDDIPAQIPNRSAADSSVRPGGRPDRLEGKEPERLQKVLEQKRWNVTAAARALGITRNTLRYRMDKYGIHKPGAA